MKGDGRVVIIDTRSCRHDGMEQALKTQVPRIAARAAVKWRGETPTILHMRSGVTTGSNNKNPGPCRI